MTPTYPVHSGVATPIKRCLWCVRMHFNDGAECSPRCMAAWKEARSG